MVRQYFIYLALIAVPASGVLQCSSRTCPHCANLYFCTLDYDNTIRADPTDALKVCPALTVFESCITPLLAASPCHGVTMMGMVADARAANIMMMREADAVAANTITASCVSGLCQDGTEPKNKLVLALLEMFLGIFGADRFYLGKFVSGFFKLITLGGCGVWYLTDLVGVLSNELKDLPTIEFLGMSGCFDADTISPAKTVAQIQILLFIISICCSFIASSLKSGGGGKSQVDSDDESSVEASSE